MDIVRATRPVAYALLADDIQLNPVPYYVTGEVVAYYPHETLHSGSTEFADFTASDTDRVVVMFNTR